MNNQHLKSCYDPRLTYLIGRESSGCDVVGIKTEALQV